MTHDGKIITTKAVCSVVIGVTFTLGSGLAQWVDSGQTPGTIAWIIIISTCLGNGASKLTDFLSSAYSNFREKKDAETQFLANTATKQP